MSSFMSRSNTSGRERVLAAGLGLATVLALGFLVGLIVLRQKAAGIDVYPVADPN